MGLATPSGEKRTTAHNILETPLVEGNVMRGPDFDDRVWALALTGASICGVAALVFALLCYPVASAACLSGAFACVCVAVVLTECMR